MFHIGIATQHPPLPEPGQLSDIGIEFIELCLSLDPADRPTASELLLHPWVAATAKEMVSIGCVATLTSARAQFAGVLIRSWQLESAFHYDRPN
jgi:serine/threonine protein kinase